MTTPIVEIHFAGLTGPERSGGDMAIAFTLIVNGYIQTTSAKYVPANPDGSWHTATYLALAYAVEQCHRYLGAPLRPLFFTDNKMVVQQMEGNWGAKDGHYMGSRYDALQALGAVCTKDHIGFVWVPHKANRAIPSCRNLFQSLEVAEWSWKKEQEKQENVPGTPRNPFVNLKDGSKIAWSELKQNAKDRDTFFEVPGAENGISFWLGPDMFAGSYRLSWLTAAEKEGGPDAYQDHRVRSNEPDDFLSRIRHLISGSDDPFVPND